MARITAFSPGIYELIGVIRGMVCMAFFTITLNKGRMEDSQTLFHIFMATETKLLSLYRQKEFVRGRMGRVAGITLSSLGGWMHIYFFKLLYGLLMTFITKSWQCIG